MFLTVVLVVATLLASRRPWRTDDPEWFQASALLSAVLAGALLLALL
jgi:hypothetical protein